MAERPGKGKPFGGKQREGKPPAGKGKPGKSGDDWSGEFDRQDHERRFPPGRGPEGAEGHGERGDGKAGRPGGAKAKIAQIEPHESGEGSRVRFHPEVDADLKAGGDYRHHVTEHAKHYAGYLTSKEAGDPERAEAHRHAANLHARIGNAMHAGGDTQPTPPAPDPALMGLEPEGEFGPDGERVGGSGGPPGNPVGSPGKDALGRPEPGKPDGKRNPPAADTAMAMRRATAAKPPAAAGGKKGGKPGQGSGPPMSLLGKSRVIVFR